jgi:hypothetical protein
LPDEIGQIGTGASSKNVRKIKNLQKIKVKGIEDRNRKNISVKLTKFAME